MRAKPVQTRHKLRAAGGPDPCGRRKVDGDAADIEIRRRLLQHRKCQFLTDCVDIRLYVQSFSRGGGGKKE